jgi:ABC-type uncharacterized transport system permease subunit
LGAVKRARDRARDATPVALAVSILCGATALYCTEVIYGNISDEPGTNDAFLPPWRGHMAGVCIGLTVQVISLFLLQKVGGRSSNQAIRSALPWVPLVVVAGFATVVHIPALFVVTVIVLYSPWAYARMKAGSRKPS